MRDSYHSGDTQAAGIVGGIVFFVALMVTSLKTDAWSSWTGTWTLVGDSFDFSRMPPPPTEIEKFATLALWIGPPIVLSVAAMWLVLVLRDRLDRDAG